MLTKNFSDSRQNAVRARAVGLLVCVLISAGCATDRASYPAQAGMERTLKEAETVLSAGHREKAVVLLNQATKEYPASMAPWLKMATLQFEAGNYPEAILAANEVLQRDASNQEAKSLLVVAGLRVAAEAVTDLRSANMVSPSTRIEAENLTSSLRTVLGEKVLVPVSGADHKSSAQSVRPVQTAKSKVRGNVSSHTKPLLTTTPVQASAAMPSSSAAENTDPFKSLK